MAYIPPNANGQATKANSSPVVIASDQDTLAVSISGGATAAKQDTGNASLASIDGKITAVNTGAVTVASSALPTGAATAAKQPALGTAGSASADVLTVQGRASMTPILTDGSATTQPVSGTVTATVTGVSTATKQSDGSQKNQVVDGSGNVVGATSNALEINIKSGNPTTITATQGTATNLKTQAESYQGGTAVSSSNPLEVNVRSATVNSVTGNVAHDAVDLGNPVKIGGKATTTAPAVVADGDRVDATFDKYGDLKVSNYNPEMNHSVNTTALRDNQVAQRYTNLADSLADGLASFWATSTANGGTATSTGGEGVLDTSASATGSAQLTSTLVPYYPGQQAWFNSAGRLNDTGSAGNIRRWGVFTVSGTTPQEGFYYELSGTTLNAVSVKGGTPTATAVASWSRNASDPFTLDTSYHQWEIRFTSNTAWFLVDNILRHSITGGTSAVTTTLNFPITLQSINTSGATSRTLNMRNVGVGRFGEPSTDIQGRRSVFQQSSTSTSSNVSAATSSTTLLAANMLRIGASIANDSTDILYIKFGTAASTTSYKVALSGKGSGVANYYEIPAGYNGIITGIWSGTNGAARIAEET